MSPLFIIFFAILIVIPVCSFVMMLRSIKGNARIPNGEAGAKRGFAAVLLSFLLFFFVVLGFFLNSFGERAGIPLKVFSVGGTTPKTYASLANDHVFPMIVCFVLGIIAFGMLSTHRGKLSPILYIVCSSLLLSHIIITVAYVTHTGFTHYDETLETTGSIIFLQIGYLSLSFLYIGILKDSLDHFLESLREREIKDTNKLLAVFYRISFSYKNMPFVWAISLFPIILIIQFILILFGQRPDSLIRAFLDTSNYNYSSVPTPEPEIIPGDAHYLCTVSVKGHKKLVRPVRAGIRQGTRITVNRQLLIANAFEHVLEEYIPYVHKKIRFLYDRYGYPISKHIQTKWSADIVYIAMKPLEWLFIIVLYTVDRHPENRINIQYSELRK